MMRDETRRAYRRRIRRRALAGACLLIIGWSGTTRAQTVELPVSYTLEIWQSGASAPMLSGETPASSAACALPHMTVDPTSPVVNPVRVRWADPANAQNDCELQPTTFLFSVPIGTSYRATVVANGATTRSARSAPSNPFDRVPVPVPPPVPIDVRVGR